MREMDDPCMWSRGVLMLPSHILITCHLTNLVMQYKVPCRGQARNNEKVWWIMCMREVNWLSVHYFLLVSYPPLCSHPRSRLKSSNDPCAALQRIRLVCDTTQCREWVRFMLVPPLPSSLSLLVLIDVSAGVGWLTTEQPLTLGYL